MKSLLFVVVIVAAHGHHPCVDALEGESAQLVEHEVGVGLLCDVFLDGVVGQFQQTAACKVKSL